MASWLVMNERATGSENAIYLANGQRVDLLPSPRASRMARRRSHLYTHDTSHAVIRAHDTPYPRIASTVSAQD
jgi:hypothetical protein